MAMEPSQRCNNPTERAHKTKWLRVASVLKPQWNSRSFLPEFSCYCGGDNTHKGTPKDMRGAAKNNTGKSYEQGLGKYIFYDNILF